MVTLELRRGGDLDSTITVRARTEDAALHKARRLFGEPGTALWIERFPGGGTIYVQFGTPMRTGGVSLSDRYIGHVSGEVGA